MKSIYIPLLAVALPTYLAAEAKPVIVCEGKYPHHLQGVCRDAGGNYHWSFTTTLVKTDAHGKVLKKIKVANHHGDLCHVNGRLFVAVNFGAFNNPEGKANNSVHVYRAMDLKLLAKHAVPEVKHGAGGLAHHEGRFLVVGGLPQGVEENYVYEYDAIFKFKKRHVIKSGWTKLGIQSATFAHGHWWFGCYGNVLLKTTPNFNMSGKYNFNCGYGILPGLKKNSVYAATDNSSKVGRGGMLTPHTLNELATFSFKKKE